MSVDYLTLAGLVAVIAFLWNLHRDIRGLDQRLSGMTERVARLEGLLEGVRDVVTAPGNAR